MDLGQRGRQSIDKSGLLTASLRLGLWAVCLLGLWWVGELSFTILTVELFLARVTNLPLLKY